MRSKDEPMEEAEETTEWKKEHDTYLRSIVSMYGVSDWNIVADCMTSKFGQPGKTAKQCKDRWRSCLDTNCSKQTWSDRERYLLLVAHQKYKNRWSDVALMLKKHSSNMIKNRFYTLFRKVRNKIKNGDFIINSALDLLEIYYILSLIEEYQKAVPGKSGAADQVDKNYAHKLVQQIDRQKAEDYKAKVSELHKDHGKMAQLFDQYANEFGLKVEKPKPKLSVPKEEPACNGINLPESDIREPEPVAQKETTFRIELPVPRYFAHKSGMTDEEKGAFWRFAFQIREPLSGREECKSVNSMVSVRSPARSVDCSAASAMREDEGFGFSQFATPFEGAADQPNSVPAPAVSSSIPTAGMSFLTVPTAAGRALPGGYTQHTAPAPTFGASAFRPVEHTTAWLGPKEEKMFWERMQSGS